MTICFAYIQTWLVVRLQQYYQRLRGSYRHAIWQLSLQMSQSKMMVLPTPVSGITARVVSVLFPFQLGGLGLGHFSPISRVGLLGLSTWCLKLTNALYQSEEGRKWPIFFLWSISMNECPCQIKLATSWSPVRLWNRVNGLCHDQKTK